MERLVKILRLIASLVGAIAVLGFVGARSSFVSELPSQAFLTKSAEGYTLLYQISPAQVYSEVFATLDLAVQGAAAKGYRVSRDPKSRRPIFEKTWMESSPAETIVFWKLRPYQDALRLRFQNSNEAIFFYQAFLDGAYSPSPTGHSLLLVRK